VPDFLNDLITAAYAADVYGVILDKDGVGQADTDTGRARLRAKGKFNPSFVGHFFESVQTSPYALRTKAQ